MFDTKVRDLVFASLVADVYCLASHWIYDEEQLKNLNIDWNKLNNACSIWHKGKKAGEFTHYGDQTYSFYKFIQKEESFDVNKYIKNWQDKMLVYNGYIDGSTRDTLKNIDDGLEIPCGASSDDFSIISRIVPLLQISSSKEEFFKNAKTFVQATHNNSIVLESADFFAQLLVEVLSGKDIVLSIENLKEKYSSTIQNWITQALDSKNSVSFKAIRDFGPACSVEGSFASVLHILVKYTDFKEAMIVNAKAGGDNSSRAMMIAPLLVAAYGVNKIPQEWTKMKENI